MIDLRAATHGTVSLRRGLSGWIARLLATIDARLDQRAEAALSEDGPIPSTSNETALCVELGDAGESEAAHSEVGSPAIAAAGGYRFWTASSALGVQKAFGLGPSGRRTQLRCDDAATAGNIGEDRAARP